MKSRLLIAASVSGIIAGGVPASARAASADRPALRSTAEAKLAAVTVRVDQANVMYSPVDGGDGPNFAKVVQYQQEYMAGRQSLQDGKYAEARCICAKQMRLSTADLNIEPELCDFRKIAAIES